MIDIHHHCLPEVDDGPKSWADAVELCRMSAAEGIEVIVATPHVLRGRWRTVAREELESRLAELNERMGGTPRILLGSEYFFGHDIAEILTSGKEIIPLAGGRYVLVELAANAVPPMIERPLHAIQLDGWTPILAHPERNIVFQAHPELLIGLVELGVKVQITTGSLTGAFGKAARAAAEGFLRRQLVHFAATDAHDPVKRPPIVRAAAAAIEEAGGARLSQALLYDNPLAVIENRPLPWDPEPIEVSDGFFTRLRGFFGSFKA